MKRILFLLFILSPLALFSQVQLTDNDSAWTFTRIVQVDSLSKLQLFARANEWFVKEGYNKSRSFINENETGKLESDVVIASDANGATLCKVQFLAKDNKYKFSMYDFRHDMAGPLSQEKSGKVMLGMAFSKGKWDKIKSYATIYKNAKLGDFVKYMEGIKKEEDF